jgi:esterase
MRLFRLSAAVIGVFVCAAALAAQSSSPVRIVANGVELHYFERGQGEPVILLHGGQADYRAWQPQIDALSPRYRVIAYSRRYHYPNRNPLNTTNHSALIDALDLAALIKSLNLGRVHLIGTSYGAFTAMAFALNEPHLVRSMVLAEPPVHQWIADRPRGRALFDEFLNSVHHPARRLFEARDDTAAMRFLIDAFDGKGTFDAMPEERRAVVMANAAFFKATTASAEPFPNLPKDRVRQLRMPVLVIQGANTDALHAMVTEEVASVFPNASRATIPDAGHGSPRQNPQAFNAAVLEFLNRR